MASLRGWLATFSVLLAAAMGSVSGRFIVEKNNVRVLSPEHLRGHHNAAIANFGVPDYGGTLTGAIVYPDRGVKGCNAFDKTFRSQTKRPVILLLDRGGNKIILLETPELMAQNGRALTRKLTAVGSLETSLRPSSAATVTEMEEETRNLVETKTKTRGVWREKGRVV